MTSILLRLVLLSTIKLTRAVARIVSNISTAEKAIATRISTWPVGERSKHVPGWLKGFVRRDNLTTIELITNHNLTVLPTRAFVLWPRNRIYHLNHMSLQLPTLSSISLSENQLTHLGDMSTCQWSMANKRIGFVTISLEHNRWHCNGSMLWLQSSLCKDSRQLPVYYIRQPQGLIIEISRLICQSPLGFQGQALIDLNHIELNKLDICSKGEYYLMMDWSFHICVSYVSPDHF